MHQPRRMAVDGQDCGVVNPLDPYVDISHTVTPGQAATIALHIKRWQRQPAGDVVLLEGWRADGWSVAGAAEQALWAAAERRIPRLQIRAEECSIAHMPDNGTSSCLGVHRTSSD